MNTETILFLLLVVTVLFLTVGCGGEKKAMQKHVCLNQRVNATDAAVLLKAP